MSNCRSVPIRRGKDPDPGVDPQKLVIGIDLEDPGAFERLVNRPLFNWLIADERPKRARRRRTITGPRIEEDWPDRYPGPWLLSPQDVGLCSVEEFFQDFELQECLKEIREYAPPELA